MTPLIQEALRVAQDLDVAVFPVGADKRPIIKGWRARASSNPDDIEAMFSLHGAAGVAIPCGPHNDIICFDLDFGHTDDEDRKARLMAWAEAFMADAEGKVEVRRTRSGGMHILAAWPDDQPPRRIMPKLDVIIDGFYFVYWMGDGYSHVSGELTTWFPTEKHLEVVERDTLGTGAALMSAEDAHTAMWSDGDSGQRHDALLRLTYDWAAEHTDMTLPQLCESFAAWFSDIYGDRIDAGRLAQLTEWRYDRRSGEAEGELGRAMRGAHDRAPISDALLAAAGEKLRAKAAPTVSEVVERKVVADEFTDIDLTDLLREELKDVDWIVDDLLPAGNLVSVSGPSGGGKTRFNAMLMAALSTGNTDKVGLPKASRPVRSLYIANEERTEDVKRRLKAAAKLNGLDGEMLITVRGKEHGRFALIGSDGALIEAAVDRLVSVIKDRGIEVVMIDPIVTIGIEEENAAAQVDVAMAALQAVAARAGACVLFVHHSPKGDRNAPEDQLRGDSGAWRGSGVFYSSLDIGLTLMPWLPDECHEKGNGPANRRRWRSMVRNHKAPKYVVLDSAKERENEGLGSVMYEIVGQEVRVGGRRIGAMRPVQEADARATATMLLTSVAEIDDVVAQAWAAALLDHPDWCSEGEHRVTLKEVAQHLDDAAPVGWPERQDRGVKLRSDRGLGKHLTEVLAGPLIVGRTMVSLQETLTGFGVMVRAVS